MISYQTRLKQRIKVRDVKLCQQSSSSSPPSPAGFEQCVAAIVNISPWGRVDTAHTRKFAINIVKSFDFHNL